jgi:hypothetical protein
LTHTALTHPALAGWVPRFRSAGKGAERSEADEGQRLPP